MNYLNVKVPKDTSTFISKFTMPYQFRNLIDTSNNNKIVNKNNLSNSFLL